MQVGRRIIVSLVALLIFGLTPLRAQTSQTEQAPGANPPDKYGQGMGRHGRRGSGQHTARLAEQLNLTQEQRQKLEPILQQQRQQMRTLRQDTSLTPEQKRDKMEQLRQSTHSQIMGILTPEQQEKWKQLRQDMGKRGPGGGMARLDLTPDQREKLRPIFEDTRSKMRALHQDTSLTPEQKREKARQIWQDSQAQVNSILTPEQQQQWQQMRQRRGPRMGPPPGPSGF